MPLQRNAAFPYSARIGGVGVKLKTDPQTGVELVGTKVQPFNQATPQEMSYASSPPYIEREYDFRRLIMGFGESIQSFQIVRRYHYALGVDPSINGQPMLGPEFNTVTPTVTGEVRGFYEALSGGTLKLFALCGRYVNVRNADTGVGWLLSKDFGASKGGKSAQRFRHEGAAPAEYLYVTNDNDELWRYSGATDTTVWTNITALVDVDAADQAASYLELNNDLLVRSWGNRVSTCADDPGVAANWSGTVFVGDSSQPITWLRTLSGTVFIFKTDGIYSIDNTGEPTPLFESLRVTPNVLNGRNASRWQQGLWFRYGDGFYNTGPNTSGVLEMHPVGPERFIQAGDSPIHGYVSASEGWSNWFKFISIYNSTNNTSYLMKYGSWFVDDQPPLGSTAYVRSSALFNPISSGGSFFEPVLHGAIAVFAGKKITAMKVSGIPGPNDRLYLGFDDGTISWDILPRGSPNPLSDPNCRFQATGKLYFSGHTMDLPGNTKSFRGVTTFGPILNPTDSVTFGYRISGSTTYISIGTFTMSGQRINLAPPAPGVSIDLEETLTGNGSTTPFLEGFALHEALRPDLMLTRDMVIEARDKMARRDGTADWRTAKQIRDHIRACANAKGTVPFVAPDGTTIDVLVIDYGEHLASEQSRWGNTWDLPIKCVEFKSTVLVGTVDRLVGRTVDSLVGITVDQLSTL